VLNYLKLGPDCLLFLDDKVKNIKVALDMGIKSILVNSTEQMIDELTKLGIAVSA